MGAFKWRLEATWKPLECHLEPKLAQEAHRKAPREAKLDPSGAQERPSWLQEVPKRLQVASKRWSRASKLGQRAPQEPPSDAEKVFKEHLESTREAVEEHSKGKT